MSLRYKGYKEVFEPEHRYVFTTIPCPMCQGTAEIAVRAGDLFRYGQGAKIQVAFPYLASSDRERLISGYCDPCWAKLWEEPNR